LGADFSSFFSAAFPEARPFVDDFDFAVPFWLPFFLDESPAADFSGFAAAFSAVASFLATGFDSAAAIGAGVLGRATTVTGSADFAADAATADGDVFRGASARFSATGVGSAAATMFGLTVTICQTTG
jgi:hypothetical protein